MNKISSQSFDVKTIFLLFFIVFVTIAASMLFVKMSITLAIAITIGVILAIVSFINAELALYILIISMLLGPQFLVGGAELVPGRGRAGITLRFDDFILLVIGLSWFFKTAINKELGLFADTPLNRGIGFYFAICLISTLIGYLMGRMKGLTGIFFVLKYFEYFIVYFMAVNHIKEKKQIERFLVTILVVCFIVCLVAVYQIPSGGRVSAPFEGEGAGEPNTLGGYLVLMMSIAMGLLLNYGTKKQKSYLGILLFFIVIALAATLSRSSWISLGPMFLALIYFNKKKAVIIIPLAVIIMISSFIIPENVKQRALYTVAQPAEEGQIVIGKTRIDTSTSARLASWKMVLTSDFLKQPIIGYGITGYHFLDAQYPRVLAETGLVGLFIFIYLLRTIYINARNVYRNTIDPLYKGLTVGYLAGFWAMITHGIGSNTFIIVRIMEPFWFLTAMVIMIPVLSEADEEKIKAELPIR
ncbi:MAG: O-antigen ligase family protein [Deltaproteobacteria bacterium]|nr:O-antigen ligase family protein [Deltaproteobacteria bacterium]